MRLNIGEYLRDFAARIMQGNMVDPTINGTRFYTDLVTVKLGEEKSTRSGQLFLGENRPMISGSLV